MLKEVLFSVLALGFAGSPAFAAVKAPAKVKEQTAAKKITKAPKAVPAEEADKIDASLAELNALIMDSSLKPKNGKQASLDDFKENLELSDNKATLTTDDFAKKDGGLQELSSDTLTAPESELE